MVAMAATATRSLLAYGDALQRTSVEITNSRIEACLGVLIPAGNFVHEIEFRRLGVDGVAFSFATFKYPSANPNDFCAEFANQLRDPLQLLRFNGADAILLGCTTASMVCADAGFVAQLEAIAGVPVLTAAAASILAFHALGIRSVAVASPYGEANNRIVSEFLHSNGIVTKSIKGMDLDRSVDTWLKCSPTVTSEGMLALAREADVCDAAAMYFPCIGVETLDALARFERENGKPVVSAIQAGFWASLQRLGIDARKPGFGRLIEQWVF